MASTVNVVTIPDGVLEQAYAAIGVGKPFLSTTGKLYFKIDASTCLNVEQSSVDVAPASGYQCDVTIMAQYKRG